MTTYDDDVIVTGVLSAGNVAYGVGRITPVASTPTSFEVTGLSLRGTGPVRVQLTPHTSVPGSRVVEMGVTSVTSTGFLAWIYRTNTTETNFSWLAWREA